MSEQEKHSFGVFKPTGHIVVSLPDAGAADAAAAALAQIGVASSDIQRLTDREMLVRIDDDMQNASPLASVGQEMNLIKAHRALAERGYHWLVVRANGRDGEIAECVQQHGAERAQSYGRFIIEELITPADEQAQVGESPDRGLDAQTPSGTEAERADTPSRPGKPG